LNLLREFPLRFLFFLERTEQGFAELLHEPAVNGGHTLLPTGLPGQRMACPFRSEKGRAGGRRKALDAVGPRHRVGLASDQQLRDSRDAFEAEVVVG
jgi:hypothetical protein